MKGRAFVALDGTLIACDRLAADRPSDSGKHRHHGMNVQVVAAPDGGLRLTSWSLPGAVRGVSAARVWRIAEGIAAAGLVVLADKGCIGLGEVVFCPFRGRGKP
ncbi:transposase family protein [Nocardiopsis rhodophaea]